jgi:hypothetical protein
MTDDDPSPTAIINALGIGDGTGLEIWRHLHEPHCAKHFVGVHDMPQATVYRALNHLHEACLIDETDRYYRAQRYVRTADTLTLHVAPDGELELTMSTEADPEMRREINFHRD